MNRVTNCIKIFCPKTKYKNFSTSFAIFSNISNRESNQKKSCQLEASELTSRSLIRVSGPDAKTFLQGIITNDIGHLETKPAIYSLFLNHQGRVLYDAILYSKKSGGETLIECDASVKDKLTKHLRLFRVRKKVDISDVPLKVWVVFDSAHKYVQNKVNHNYNTSHDSYKQEEKSSKHLRIVEEEVCCSPIVNNLGSKRDDLALDDGLEAIGDPRLKDLGWRVLVPENQSFPPKDIERSDEISYKELRYSLGVGEGVVDLPSGSCFPLESNGDYLHGISFQKGCYIGQELTARTHHTGVIRKRLMPFRLLQKAPLPNDLDPSTLQIINENNKVVGKVRGISNSYGIVLARIEEVAAASVLKLGNHTITLGKPFWWPLEASKESRTGGKK